MSERRWSRLGRAGGGGRGPRVSDVVGVPALPPAFASAGADRLRAGIAALHRRLAPPPLRVLESAFGLLDHGVLGALCALDVPDRLDGPTPVEELARRVGADAEVVGRLVAYGAARGWLRIDRSGRVRPTATTRFLRRDHPGGWRAWVDFTQGDEVVAAVVRLANDPRADDAFAAANGASLFDWYAAHPDRHRAFDAAMAAGARLHGLALAGAVDWADAARVCDVGGGTGALLATLLDRHPHLHGVLLDLPEVVARAQEHPRLRVEAGDAFAGVPAGCDTYLFVNVLHDWDDDACVRLLAPVAAAARVAPRAGAVRAVVVEGERRPRPRDGVAARSDALMLALAPGGRERTTAEIGRLAARAGLPRRRTVGLASGDRAHVLTLAPV